MHKKKPSVSPTRGVFFRLLLETHRIRLDTRGEARGIDLSPDVNQEIARGEIGDGIMWVSVTGSTSCLTRITLASETIVGEQRPDRVRQSW